MTDTPNTPPEPIAEAVAPSAVAQPVSSAVPAVAATAAAGQEKLIPATSLPSTFRFGAVRIAPLQPGAPAAAPNLGPLAAFVGNWRGNGFNTIFRPDFKSEDSSKLPIPVTNSDNILELNLTAETLSFSPSLGSVPNRGMVQTNIFLNGVPYLQSISDITQGLAQKVGIHLEPGLWVIVPSTTDPPVGSTSLVRMASIPHGTTIVAQGTSVTVAGPPTINPVDITPFPAISPGETPPTTRPPRIRFPSQTLTDGSTARIPQDLTPFNAAGTITQAILDDPNTLLRNHIHGQTITSTTAIIISTSPTSPLFGGGTGNIAFLLGDPAALTNPKPPGQNAQDIEMSAIFWIETVQHTILVPPIPPGHPPMEVPSENSVPGVPSPTFILAPPTPITQPRRITFTTPQIQYTQLVMLNFNGLTWPHASVATLVPADPIPVPPSVWS